MRAGLAEEVRPPGVLEQPVRRPDAGVHVRVDEARRDDLAPRVDLAIGLPLVGVADEQNLLVFHDDDAVAVEPVAPLGVADHPAAAY